MTCLLIALLAAAPAVAATYKWVDKDGKVHYSDKPQPGAEKVELKPLTEIESQPSADSETDATPPPMVAANDGSYASLRITSPQDQTTLRGGETTITIDAAVEPGLAAGDQIEYLMDGKVVPQVVEGIERGSHAISARVLGANGQIKIIADPVTIYFHQSTVPPPARPKPKKTI